METAEFTDRDQPVPISQWLPRVIASGQEKLKAIEQEKIHVSIKLQEMEALEHPKKELRIKYKKKQLTELEQRKTRLIENIKLLETSLRNASNAVLREKEKQ